MTSLMAVTPVVPAVWREYDYGVERPGSLVRPLRETAWGTGSTPGVDAAGHWYYFWGLRRGALTLLLLFMMWLTETPSVVDDVG